MSSISARLRNSASFGLPLCLVSALAILSVDAGPSYATSAGTNHTSISSADPGLRQSVPTSPIRIGPEPTVPLARGGCDHLQFTADGSYEDAYAWRNDGQQLPYYGAFAERYTAEGPVCAVVFDLTQLGLYTDQLADIYVWDDADGIPGAVLCLQPDVDLGPIAFWPTVSRHVVELTTACAVGSSWWVGQWGHWTSPNAWFMAADLDGPLPGFPFTDIAPGTGYPSGWNNVSVVWAPTRALGIGAVTGGDPPPPPETLQALVDAALDGETLWIPPGTYTGPGNYDIDFGGKNLEFRSVEGPANTIIDCAFLGRAFVFDDSEDATSLVEGFTIRRGSAGLSPGGGGALIELASPTLRNCIFDACVSTSVGGALALYQSSSQIEACTFSANLAHLGQGGGGGAIYLSESPTTIDQCQFLSNDAEDGAGRGGALYLDRSDARVDGCELLENQASVEGGAVFVSGGTPVLAQCRISGNEATGRGGAVYLGDGSTAQIEWSRITGNRARDAGGGIYSAQGANTSVVSSTLVANVAAGSGTDRGSGIFVAGPLSINRSILWGNCDFGVGAEIFADDLANVGVECSAIDPDGVAGTGIVTFFGDQVSGDPGLCLAPDPCLTQPTTGGNVHVSEDSACLPTGNPCGQLIGALWIRCPVPHIPTGACCLPDGACFPTVPELCEPYGGSYAGEGSVCDPSPCETTHAPDPSISARSGIRMSAPFPNPTRSTFEFQIEASLPGEIEVSIFSAEGRRLAPVVTRQMVAAGVHTFVFDPSAFAAGTYYLRLTSDQGETTERTVILK